MTDLPDSPPSSPGTDASDAELLRAYKAGDTAAFGVLVRRYQRPVWRMLLRNTGDESTADDLCQTAFLKACDKARDLTDEGAFRSWLYRIALNLARSRWRGLARWKTDPESELDERAGEGPSPEATAADRQRIARVRTAIDSLPRLQREVVRLRLQAELPFKDIAQVLGTTESSAKVSYHHAVKKLRDQLGGIQ